MGTADRQGALRRLIHCRSLWPCHRRHKGFAVLRNGESRRVRQIGYRPQTDRAQTISYISYYRTQHKYRVHIHRLPSIAASQDRKRLVMASVHISNALLLPVRVSKGLN